MLAQKKGFVLGFYISLRFKLGQNKFTIKPVMTNPAASIFQGGKDSPRKKADDPMPKMGTNRGAGATTAAGCLESNQPHAA
jgi:hypothetical protein